MLSVCAFQQLRMSDANILQPVSRRRLERVKAKERLCCPSTSTVVSKPDLRTKVHLCRAGLGLPQDATINDALDELHAAPSARTVLLKGVEGRRDYHNLISHSSQT
jgi:hypothetical protein